MTPSYRTIAERAVREVAPAAEWRVQEDETWCMVSPPRHVCRDQGWKLHLSATPRVACRLLAAAARVLVAHHCAFKFAVTPQVAAELNSVWAVRGQSGKFITAYPADDDQLRLLAEQLHRATAGLDGPAILSDRRYHPDSPVYYRYGCFARPHELNDEGFYEGRLRAPDGSSEPDRREAWFSPPTWVPLPFDPPAPEDAAWRRRGGPVRLADRYLVKEAIRHSNRGGVYRARDERTGADVLLKEARPHVAADPSGRDARDWLRYEAEVLRGLAPRGVAPAVHEVFTAAEHVFLVEELIHGGTLQQWAVDRARQAGGRMPARLVRQLAGRLARLIGEVHAAGFVLRDFKPSNVMMAADDTPVLVDLECAARPGEPVRVVGTRGFTAPEYLATAEPDDPPRPAPGPAVDCYSLGATLLYVSTGINPVLTPDIPAARTDSERIAAIVRAALPEFPALRALAPAILGLTAEPAGRWSLAAVASFLAAEPQDGPVPPAAEFASEDLDRLLTDGLAHLAETVDPAAEYLWARPRSLPYGDACNVQMGAAGVLAVLDRAVRCGHRAAEPTLRTAAHWLDRHLERPSRTLPGLFFGRSGTAWALYDAARTLGDEALASRAVDYALRIPLDWHNPDVCHGLAGAGTAQLHLWHATGDQRFAERASECADRVVRLSSQAQGGVDWPLGEGVRSELAGAGSYGFGHGVAGLGTFLAAAGRDLGRPELLEIAVGGGQVLCAVAESAGDSAEWPKGPGRTERMGLNFWCNGSSGIGTFLVRLWQQTGIDRFRAHAERAGVAVHQNRWRLGPGDCHGVAGNAELLLDLAEATGEQRYRGWAAESATCLFVRAAHRGGRLVVPDDTLRDICASYHVGFAGVLDFLFRLRHGGHRSWLVDTGRPVGRPSAAEKYTPRGESNHGYPGSGTAGTARNRRGVAGAADVL
ncbi:serine/threonine protein kinase [Kitasatospora sp. GP30]|uniref:class IV lanthionine synthetase LanL n=1 Tax=Kitasatospora sp. GP30 TaxID=3035084 RepID=UPI000C70554A|nr:class IV lanthionine synthetase LanL [Kitasatospora sp. GP30]MDH6138983.1 serine/threonine protein kinase [Kitasatospora sp. GP30]